MRTKLTATLLGAAFAASALAQPPQPRPDATPPGTGTEVNAPPPSPRPVGPAQTAPFQERPGVGVAGPGPAYGERILQRTGPAGQSITIRSGQPGIPNAADYRLDFDQLDQIGRGYITRNDIPEGHPLQREFHVVDRDRDGRLTREELSGWLR